MYLAELLIRACQVCLFEPVSVEAILSSDREQPQVKRAPWIKEKGGTARVQILLSTVYRIMTSSNLDNATSLSSATDASDPLSSLSGDVEHIFQLLGHDVPDDIADQDIETLLQQLERADSIGQDVEGRVDAVLERLDHLLSTLQHDGEPQAVDAQAGKTESKKADDPGR